ncbi:MAG: hypothetical protein C4308_09475 [Chitinophagaceae bacterium]
MKKLIAIIAVFTCLQATAQFAFSLSTDLSVLRNFKKDQQFWAFGQNIITDFHLTPQNGIYLYACYYSDGRFENKLTATAKSFLTNPQQINFINRAKVRLKEFSVGWKHYLKGNIESGKWNVYSMAGFGIIFGKAFNEYTMSIDTALYNLPQRPVNSSGRFKRLTFDLGLGTEYPLGAEVYLYGEGKVWVPASSYPSKYLFVNENAPFSAVFSLGLRVLF